jgi:ubiquinone/menaquinone biosynthesis C-methylase UbiE
MAEDASTEQAAMYATGADAYDDLIAAEDADGKLLPALADVAPFEGRRVADIGAGTGRFARLLAGRAAHVDLVDRAQAMLEVARRRLAAPSTTTFSFHVADARTLPLTDGSVDLAVAGGARVPECTALFSARVPPVGDG